MDTTKITAFRPTSLNTGGIMSDYCLYPNQCGPGMDCYECYIARIKQLEADQDSAIAQFEKYRDAYNALREELAQRGEPVAWRLKDIPEHIENEYADYHRGDEWEPLYTAPPAPAVPEGIRGTVSFLKSYLNEINKAEDWDRDELLEYHLELALQWLTASPAEDDE